MDGQECLGMRVQWLGCQDKAGVIDINADVIDRNACVIDRNAGVLYWMGMQVYLKRIQV